MLTAESLNDLTQWNLKMIWDCRHLLFLMDKPWKDLKAAPCWSNFDFLQLYKYKNTEQSPVCVWVSVCVFECVHVCVYALC